MSKIKFGMLWLVAASLVAAACGQRDSGDESGFSIPQSPLLAALERKAGLIAYVGTDGNVYTVDQGGQNPTSITTDGNIGGSRFRFYEFPTWSPDGKSLAFYGLEGTSQTDISAAIYTVDADGQNLVKAYSDDRHVPIYLSWSPDSSKVTFISSIAGGSGLVLNMIPAAGGKAEVLDVGAPYYWDWLPDGTGVIVHTGGAGSTDPLARLALLTLTDGVVEDTLALEPALFQSPALSPNGAQVLLAVEDGNQSQLVLTDRLGQIEKKVADVTGPVAFEWSPDGKWLAYISGVDPTGLALGPLTFVELGGDQKTEVTDKGDVVAFFWAPDGKQAAYFVPEQIPPEEGSTEPGGFFFKMYVTTVGSGESKLIASFIPTQDFVRTIPYFDQYSRSNTIWSPDSQNIVLSAYTPDGTPGVFVVPASGITDPRFLQPGVVAFWSAK